MPPEKIEKARELRRQMTEPERILWWHLRNKKLDGYKFRRQNPMLGYIADFYCASAKLIIEVDGKTHEEQLDYDRKRDRDFLAVKIRTLRIPARTVYQDLPSALELIKAALSVQPFIR